MKLYSYFRSSAAYRVRIVLNLKHINYDTVPVHLVKDSGQQHSIAYLAINPQGLLPCLDVAAPGSKAQIITQSGAIIEYLEERFPQPSLLPTSLIERAYVRSLMHIIACDMHPVNNLRVLHYLEEHFDCNKAEKIRWYHHWLAKGFAAIETLLARKGSTHYCYNEQVTMADVYLIPQVYNALRFNFDMTPYPAIRHIYQHCMQLPTFSQAAPEQQPDAE
ncbi:maleylacetoacetate isomerase [Moritella sp. Urea-trap-13]|uniref:maleylacetoacetate isomerase n=1 Tax=Moritella sp. Urea-trap-13 TaxID=2058327 RepID=UPI000C31CA65|nr:maleylacetoacetate isomerase [Moritella sp. Urea-trap-13]PKH07567.1 maleylacetoacetate isomerase [Moritella sp. Urea-trap-13]